MLLCALLLVGLFVYLSIKQEVFLLKSVIFLMALYGVVAVFVEWELMHVSEDLTYGSDARYYWGAALQSAYGLTNWTEYAAPAYVLWQVFIVQTSPIPSFLWVLCANIVLLAIAFSSQALVIKTTLLRFGYPPAVVQRAIILLTVLYTNGIVIWTVVRGLKEPAIWAIVTISATFGSLNWKHFVAAWILWYLRPLGSVLAFGFWLSQVALQRILRARIGFGLLLLMLMILPALLPLLNHIDLLKLFRESFGQAELENAPIHEGIFSDPILGGYASVLRFILGPGPFRSIQQIIEGGIFQESTKLGDFLILLGSVSWWLLLVFATVLFLTPKGRRKLQNSLLLFGGWLGPAIIVLLTYSFIYFGTGDTRHRATLYIVSFPLFIGLFLPSFEGRGGNHENSVSHHPG